MNARLTRGIDTSNNAALHGNEIHICLDCISSATQGARMAWRLADSIVRGEIDNRTRGRVKARIWLLGVDRPVTLSLSGNCLKDIAGCLLTFENPSPREGDHVNLHAVQEGSVGDMTASRKVRVASQPLKETHPNDPPEAPGEHIGNCLYLEWFSNTNGRVVIETTNCRLRISEPSWAMSPSEDEHQLQANCDAIKEWVDHISSEHEPDEESFDPDILLPMNEFEWEKSLRESDRLTDRYSVVFDKYVDHPDRERLIAREMGWTWLEDALDADERGAFDDEKKAMEDLPPLEPNPLTEGTDWVRTEKGRITHPLSHRAFEIAIDLWRHCDGAGLLGDDGNEDIHDLVFHTQTLSAKLAGALDGLAYDRVVEGGFVVACLKRSLQHFDAAMAALDKVRKDVLMEPSRTAPLLQSLFKIREDILSLMQHYRQV
jgi:hypothetical protein